MKIYITRKMPDPRDGGYEAALAEQIEHYVGMSKGRAFVLFTSYKAMTNLASLLRSASTTSTTSCSCRARACPGIG